MKLEFPIYKLNLDYWLFDVVLDVKNGEVHHKCFRLSDGKVDYFTASSIVTQKPIAYESASYGELPYLVSRLIEEGKYR